MKANQRDKGVKNAVNTRSQKKITREIYRKYL